MNTPEKLMKDILNTETDFSKSVSEIVSEYQQSKLSATEAMDKISEETAKYVIMRLILSGAGQAIMEKD